MPQTVSVALATEILTITFDQGIDEMMTTAVPSQFILTDGVESFPAVNYVELVGAVLRMQMDLPGVVPLELTCTLASGTGVVVGMNGLEVAPFSGVPVTVE